MDEIDVVHEDEPNRILITFVDDHAIHGMKMEIIGVTPEQVAVAIFHLGRIADTLADHAVMQDRSKAAEINAVATAIMKDRGQN